MRDCQRPHAARGFCDTHYKQRRKSGELPRLALPSKCSVEWCRKKRYSRGYCKIHYERSVRGADMDSPIVDRRAIDAEVASGTAHHRVYNLWGSASRYPCIACGEPARDWAYDGTDPTQLYGIANTSGSKVFYSRYPEFYAPMCRRCHAFRDRGAITVELQEYRALRHETGLSYREIRALIDKALESTTEYG